MVSNLSRLFNLLIFHVLGNVPHILSAPGVHDMSLSLFKMPRGTISVDIRAIEILPISKAIALLFSLTQHHD